MFDSTLLRKRRLAAGLNIGDLAARSGVDPTTIFRIEHGQDPRLSTWGKISAALLPLEGEGEISAS